MNKRRAAESGGVSLSTMSASQSLFTTPTALIRHRKSRNRSSARPFQLEGETLKRTSWLQLFVSSSVRVGRENVSTKHFTRYHTPTMEWQDCRMQDHGRLSVLNFKIPAEQWWKWKFPVALYSDRESFPSWMPIISSVKVSKENPDFSLWTFSYEYLGHDYKFSWLACDIKPIPNQKIHWHSVDGIPNRGAVRFFPRGSSSCTVELTVSYEIPQILSPLGTALRPFMDDLLQGCLHQFAAHATSYRKNSSSL